MFCVLKGKQPPFKRSGSPGGKDRRLTSEGFQGERHILVLFFWRGRGAAHLQGPGEKVLKSSLHDQMLCDDDRERQEAGRAGTHKDSLRAMGCPGGLGRG